MTVEFRARVRYDEEMLRRAVRAFVWRRVVTNQVIWIAAFALPLLALAVSARASVLTGVALATILFLVLGLVSVWRAHTRNTIGRFRAMDPPEADFVFTEDALTASSNLGSTTIPWSQFKAVWDLTTFWMLFIGPASFSTIPLATLDAATIAFVRAKLPTPEVTRLAR